MDNTSDIDFSYDNIGRLTSETSSGTVVSYEYDLNNNLEKVIHPDLRETVYGYDSLNRNTTVSFSGETIATYSYTGVLNDTISYGNGLTITNTYDDLLRLASLDNGVKSYTYSYDKANNIISNSHKDYVYDDMYRITGVTGTASGTTLESFDYDNAGNRVSDLDNEYTTNILNQYTTLSGTTNFSYTYDNNGNTTNNGQFNFEYDYKNRLIKVTDQNGLVAEYNYDVLGRRTSKTLKTKVLVMFMLIRMCWKKGRQKLLELSRKHILITYENKYFLT